MNLEHVTKIFDAVFVSLHTYSGHRYRATKMANAVHKVFESSEFIEHMPMSLKDCMVDLVKNSV